MDDQIFLYYHCMYCKNVNLNGKEMQKFYNKDTLLVNSIGYPNIYSKHIIWIDTIHIILH